MDNQLSISGNSVSKKKSILASMGLTKSTIECEYEIDATNFIFNDRIEIGKKAYLCNKKHTIAIFLMDDINDILQVWNLNDESKSLTEGEYYVDLEIVGKYPLWDEMKEYNQLDSPKYFIYRNGFPIIVVYEKMAYVIAPTIDKKEDGEGNGEENGEE